MVLYEGNKKWSCLFIEEDGKNKKWNLYINFAPEKKVISTI